MQCYKHRKMFVRFAENLKWLVAGYVSIMIIPVVHVKHPAANVYEDYFVIDVIALLFL